MRSSKLGSGRSEALGRDAAAFDTLAHTDSSLDVRSASGPDLATRLIGRVFRRKWRLERLLGVGGMSLVYAATHRNGNRVAIKVLKPELAANGIVRQRFLREGYIANRVGHDGAATVLDDDCSEDGLFFLVIELVHGETLEAYSQRRGGKVPAGEVTQLSEQLLEVVAAAHHNHIIHRDIKPSNVFRTPEGRIKLLDFGIATIRESALVSQTASEAVLGTPAFMSPEQARGRHDEVDVRADLWAVGATMFRLLSGRLVHERATPHETMIATATEPARSLADLCPDLPRALTRVVDTALKLDPAQRFQTAASMLFALRGLDHSEPAVHDQPTSGVAKRPRPMRVYLSLAALVTALLALSALVVRLPGLLRRHASPAGSAMRLDASRGRASGATASVAIAPPSVPSSQAASSTPTGRAGTQKAPQSPRQPLPPRRLPRSTGAPTLALSASARPQPPTATSAGSNLGRILGSRR